MGIQLRFDRKASGEGASREPVLRQPMKYFTDP